MSEKEKSREDGKSTTVNVDKAAPEPVSIQEIAAARAGLRWGITPKGPRDKNDVPGPDHPVHKIPPEKQEKMRKKGINPVLWAEMNQNNHGQGGFWAKVFQTSWGGGWIR